MPTLLFDEGQLLKSAKENNVRNSRICLETWQEGSKLPQPCWDCPACDSSAGLCPPAGWAADASWCSPGQVPGRLSCWLCSPLLIDVLPPGAISKPRGTMIQLFWESISLGFITDIFSRNQACISEAGRVRHVTFVVWLFLHANLERLLNFSRCTALPKVYQFKTQMDSQQANPLVLCRRLFTPTPGQCTSRDIMEWHISSEHPQATACVSVIGQWRERN